MRVNKIKQADGCWLVYAWEGNKLLGKVKGSERRFDEHIQAQKYSVWLRKRLKDNEQYG